MAAEYSPTRTARAASARKSGDADPSSLREVWERWVLDLTDEERADVST